MSLNVNHFINGYSSLKITLVISSLEAGGAQRVMCTMANYWSNKGWQVTLISLSGVKEDFYSLDSDVKRIGLDSLKPSENHIQAVYHNFKRLFTLRKAIKNSSADVVISFMDRMNVMTLISTCGLGLPVLISERIDPREQDIGRLWSFLRGRVYPLASKLVVQSKPVLAWASGRWPTLSSVVIHNPVFIPDKKAPSAEVLDPEFSWCIGIGRLVRQKGFDLLIDAFSALLRMGSKNWRLVILGEGEQRDALEKQIEDLGLSGQVLIPGEVKNPADYLDQADLFVMSSRYEGFPNVLLEALACRLPVVATDCPSGPGEIIQQNYNGILVEADSTAALTEAMQRLTQSRELRDQLAQNAAKSVSKFGVERIMKQWEEAIEQAIKTVP